MREKDTQRERERKIGESKKKRDTKRSEGDSERAEDVEGVPLTKVGRQGLVKYSGEMRGRDALGRWDG